MICDELGKLATEVREEEVTRARTQLKASILMGLENTGTRCEQLAQHILIYGRPLPVEEIVAKIEAADLAAVRRVAERFTNGHPTLASLGPIAQVEDFARVAARLG